jgi:hypothetical protein
MQENGDPHANGSTPDERYREFAEENAQWDRRIEETLKDLDEPASEPTPAKSEVTPA